MIGFYLAAAQFTTCLNYTHSYSAIAIPHIQQSRHTIIHTESMNPQSSSPTAYSWNTRIPRRHSQLALYNYTLAFALLHTILARSITLTGVLRTLHYTVTNTLPGIAYNSLGVLSELHCLLR
jgi:hypothetical protein